MDGQAGRRKTNANDSTLHHENGAIEDDVRALVEGLTGALPASADSPTLENLHSQCTKLREIRQVLIDAPDRVSVKDVFRQTRGFQALIGCIRSMSGYYDASKITEEQKSEFFQLLKTCLDVLSEALFEHAGNRRFFQRRVEGNGWKTLEQAIASTAVVAAQSVAKGGYDGQEQLFGCLFSFLLAEDEVTSLFRGILSKPNNATSRNGSPRTSNSSPNIARMSLSKSSGFRDQLLNKLTRKELVRNSQAVPIIFSFWIMLLHTENLASVEPLAVAIVVTIKQIIDMSKFNKAAIHGTGILSVMLRHIFSTSLPDSLRGILFEIATSLMQYGVNSLNDAYFLFRHASLSDSAATFVLQSMEHSREPPFIHFDLSLQGHSSVELRSLGRQFPPISGSAGYTVSTWFRMDKYDSNCHTTIFGACDATQTCFVLVYLERKTRNLILQTSITSSEPSVRFRNMVFEEGKWYHIALVHRRPKALSSSVAALFINGEFTEQVKCQYPSNPPIANQPSDSRSMSPSSAPPLKFAPVQAFLGTPQDLAPRIGRNVSFSKFSLASFHLIQETLSDELIAVYYRVGPRYSGNYQDALGSFQTYRASAELNMHNEMLHPGKEEKSEIVSAVRRKASGVLPESRIVFSVSPVSAMDDDDHNYIDESQLIRSLSKDAAKELQRFTRLRGNSIVINAAVPSINDALTQSRGVALLLGSPIVVVPQSLDDATWRVAGCCALGLKLIELSETKEALLRAVKFLFLSVENNWRNSEAMEKEQGFAVLAALIRERLGHGFAIIDSSAKGTATTFDGNERDELSLELLRAILKFIGYDESDPANSIIINPLAYRILVVDFDVWRKSSVETQNLYYGQFIHFSQDSKHHHFNQKRLARARIIRRLLDALKSDGVPTLVFTQFKQAFRALMNGDMSGENQRNLALFITYALHDSRTTSKRAPSVKKSLMRLRGQQHVQSGVSAASTPRSISPNENAAAASSSSIADIGIAILEIFAEFLCDKTNACYVKRFAKTVTNKWLLYLLAEEDSRVIFLSLKILARLLVVHDLSYTKKFADKTGGFIILRRRLRERWNMSPIWIICFSIMFGVDVADVDLDSSLESTDFVKIFSPLEKLKIVSRDILPTIVGMLDAGLRAVVKEQSDPTSPTNPSEKIPTISATIDEESHSDARNGRKRSISLLADIASRDIFQPTQVHDLDHHSSVTKTAIRFLADIHHQNSHFRDFAISSNYTQELLFVLFPFIVTSDTVSAETELLSKGSALTFEGQDVIIRPRAQTTTEHSIVRTQPVEQSLAPQRQRTLPIRRGSSFILITNDKPWARSSAGRFNPPMSPKKSVGAVFQVGNALVEYLLDVITGVFMDQLLNRKDYHGFGLFLKVPPGFQEHQAFFESYVLIHGINTISKALQSNLDLMREPRVLTNLSRFVTHMSEAIFEGWFLNGAEPLLDFIGFILDHVQQPGIAQIKSVRLCAQAILTIRTVFLRLVLLRLSELEEVGQADASVSFLDKMIYWQTIILSPDNSETHFLRLICYLLFQMLIASDSRVRLSAANFWRLLLVQKPRESSMILQVDELSESNISFDFLKLVELDNGSFISWVDSNQDELTTLFSSAISKTWEGFVDDENRKTDEGAKSRVAKRRERLKQWHQDETSAEDIWQRHETSTIYWRSNIHASERLRHQRAVQDLHDNVSFLTAQYARLNRILRGPCSLFEEEVGQKWRLDQTEGRCRMRARLLPDFKVAEGDYKPKRRDTESSAQNKLKVETSNVPTLSTQELVGATPAIPRGPSPRRHLTDQDKDESDSSQSGIDDDDFEIVDDPNNDENGFEDKNRKVMRSLEHGDQVQQVCNISRLVGLEAVEGLLIIGNDNLYLLDHFFQRSDGETVRVWQAPPEERDPYLQMISGRHTPSGKSKVASSDEGTRSWRWGEVISISKRRFLFRDVAVEIFFADGRSYLLIALNPTTRDDVYSRIISKAPHIYNSSALQSEDSWRLDSLRNPEEVPQTFGSKFANVFTSTPWLQATKRWHKGEISNFHYLMLINTLAGRTFNDLTQYPVFPWVIADYTSEELDLTDPRSFRDLSKPMGCQNASREAEFRERYQSFAEMGDHNAPPFHYGTHYSSAMIVTSYLIRLQPFVQSYLLLQGGSFDHADRMFYSVEKAWLSASRDNMTDVRELTPEFYYLPEFLTNINNYDFGLRQGSGQRIDNVILPPWAKGDPQIFIAKHREALESQHVSENLHRWIDLIFGFKQKGESAIEATNVFHHLSYHGAKDLDTIEDPVERLATIGIIHNFGQTPHQIFQRAHVQRESGSQKSTCVDRVADSLTRLPFPILESHERVSSLLYSVKQDRLLCSAAFRLNIPPTFDRYMEWGFTDGSVRFYAADSRKLLGLSEHLHVGQISAATFATSRTLITAGTDCTVSLWNIASTSKGVDLTPRVTLFGHRTPVTTLAASRAFATFLSTDTRGKVFLWDLNRSEFVRDLQLSRKARRRSHSDSSEEIHCARISNLTGRILLCVGSRAYVFTLNGSLLVDQDLCDTSDGDDVITACAFYEGVGDEWVERELIFTGHRRGVAKVWQLHPAKNGSWTLSLIKNLDHVDSTRGDGANFAAAITCILPMPHVVYTGDDDGRVFEWDCVQRQGA